MTTLKGIFPDSKPTKRKNFIQENVKNLRRMEQSYHISKRAEEIQKLQLHDLKKPNNKHRDFLPKMNSILSIKRNDGDNTNISSNNKVDKQQEVYRKSSSPIQNKNNTYAKKILHSTSNDNSPIKQKGKEHKNFHKSVAKLHRKVLSDSSFSYKSTKNVDDKSKLQITLKNQGIQTQDVEQMDNLYFDGIIRYPSKKYLNNNDPVNKNEVNQPINIVSTKEGKLPSDQGDVTVHEKNIQNTDDLRNSELLPPKAEVDITRINKEHTSVPSKASVRLHNKNNSNNIPPGNYRKGVVPKYIKDRKEAQEREQKAKVDLFDPHCPNGHVPLPDQERKETLRILKKNYQDYVNELNMMPIKTDTLRAQRRKADIEKQLNKLEEGIKVFSKPKVYVKMNA